MNAICYCSISCILHITADTPLSLVSNWVVFTQSVANLSQFICTLVFTNACQGKLYTDWNPHKQLEVQYFVFVLEELLEMGCYVVMLLVFSDMFLIFVAVAVVMLVVVLFQ